MIRIAELGRTEFARVRTFTRMYTQVTTEIGYLDELSITMAAVIRFLTGMQSHVRLQVVISCKSVIKWFKCMLFIFRSLLSFLSRLFFIFMFFFFSNYFPLNFCILSFVLTFYDIPDTQTAFRPCACVRDFVTRVCNQKISNTRHR